jgi:pseudaminic acid synthase
MRLDIGHRIVGEKAPVFVIAELSANHNQNFDIAVKTIHAMKEAGADAVKLQTYRPDTITMDCSNEYFQIRHGTLWDGKTLYELYAEAYTPWEWQPELKRIAEEIGLICFSSPFDKTAVDFLEKMDVPAYKVASFEITDVPLVAYIASKGKPVIISTGIATLADIEEAVDACRKKGNNQIALLKCTSEYPAPIEEANLRTMANMADTFRAVVGVSDHTLGISVPLSAVALGAKLVEKHFILDKNLGGPDAAFSLDPAEFRAMVSSIRDVERSLGEISYELNDRAKSSREFSRSLFVVQDVRKGEPFTEVNVRSIRPGQGLHPRYLDRVLAGRARIDISGGTPLNWDLIQ